MRRFLRDECGASAVEYGLMLLVVIGVGTASVLALGDATGENIDDACDAVVEAGAPGESC